MTSTTTILKTPKDLAELAAKTSAEQLALQAKVPRNILVCMGGGCIASGSAKIKEALERELAAQKAGSGAVIRSVGCLGPCVQGPVVVIDPERTFYQNVSESDAADIVRSHVVGGKPVERLLTKTSDGASVEKVEDIQFFKLQTKNVLSNCGRIDPYSIEEYIARGGYAGLVKALTGMKPDEVIDELKKSGLRGRGGAGFPAGLKWSFTRKAQGDVKYVLCNADEGDPGAFMDRSLLEGDPHSLIEGMAVAAFVVGAKSGFVYVRAEYPLAVERLDFAIERARAIGLLGTNILGTGFDFDLEIRMGSGAFVCGEETALIASVEGKRGEPRPRPPFPAEKGLWGKPTLLNNVETYVNVPLILRNGGAWFATIGTEKSGGTKVFALAGAVVNTGLVEVPIGTPLGELLYDIGGGILGGKTFKAAQIGGPSGGCIPKQHLNVPLNYESLNELGAIMGSGGLIVMDEDSCMVDVARYFLDFVQDESCGKCVPCRVGTKRMLEILERICAGEGEEGDIERLIELGTKIRETSLCGLGQSAPNPVLSTIRYFRHEYEAHIRDKRCDAGVCAGLVRAPCQSACPAGVDIPGFVSLTGERRYDEALLLHRERNPLAAICARVCFHACESKCRRSMLDAPVSVRGVKRFMVDHEVETMVPLVLENAANAARKIAVIGAGPAGLTCAYFLARLGYKPTIFEAEPKAGGMLVQTIPAYRLPRDVIAKETAMIEHLGVKIKTGVRLGKDITIEGLKKEGYEAVFLGIGAQEPVKLGLPGEDAEGVLDALAYLRQYNLTGKAQTGRDVIVVGGGNAAVDAARTALRLGAKTVTVVYRRTREEMPAYAEEIGEALKEGAVLRLLTAPVEVVFENKKATGLKCRSMILGPFDASGRRKPVMSTEPEFVLPCDLVIAAIGQRVSKSPFDSGIELAMTADKTIAVDHASGRTSVPWIFAGGDAASGAASVVEAIGAGERAAAGIDRFLSGESHAFWRTDRETTSCFDPDSDPLPYARERQPVIAVEARKNSFDEVEIGWEEDVAIRQAHRCLRCDYGKAICVERRT